MIVLVLPDLPVEDQLLAQARRGSQEAISRIFEAYFDPLYNFIRLRVDDPALAEDLASDVFIKFIQSLKGPSAPHHSLRGWLFRVARNALHDHYSQAAQLSTTTLDEWLPNLDDDSPETAAMRSLDADQVRHALRMLAPDQQEVLVLRFGQALNLQETADLMGRSLNAVKSLQFRAVETLRSILHSAAVEVEA